jgi:hypothetical protein
VQNFIDSPDSLLASLAFRNQPGQLMLITGPGRSGKTCWCLALADYASILGLDVGGLVSPAVSEDGRKVGIDLLDLRSGAQRRLAVRRGESSSGQTTEDWHFDDEALNWGNAILAQMGACQFFILDELGPLELQRGVGLINGLGLVAARHYRLACLVVRPSLLDIAQALWPWGEVFYLPSRQPLEISA